MSSQSGMNVTITPDLAGLDITVANSVHSFVRSLSIRPERQMASVRGRTSALMYSRMLATTAMGGGGGAGSGKTDTPPPGGGGLPVKAAPIESRVNTIACGPWFKR